ncbi:hypothetical protein MTR_5g079970 [Medicago truncatula]|uniref:Uncharacterized protein n=1 Tax=Medicago truncatula TaxID=3880 RepID=G7KBR8_MEDTR|nr:hypothetical protein MTR_5g079970 [Medicago truncatula]
MHSKRIRWWINALLKKGLLKHFLCMKIVSHRQAPVCDKLFLISEGYRVYYVKSNVVLFIPEIPMNAAEFLLNLATGQERIFDRLSLGAKERGLEADSG